MQKSDVVEDYSSNFPLTNMQHHQDGQFQKQRHSVKVVPQDQFSTKRGSAPAAAGVSHLPYHQHHSHQPSQSSVVATIDDDFRNQTTPGANHIDDTNYQSSEQKRNLRQQKNLQKLQKSSASKKKSTYGKSNKILLMSGTKSKMMERSLAQSSKNGTGRIPNGTGTMKERMNAARTPDLMNQTAERAAEASRTYNNPSHLLASVNDIEVSVGDYGNATGHHQTSTILADITKEDEEEEAGGGPMISVFDQLEEMQFMSYELGTKLKSLVETIGQSATTDAEYFHPSQQHEQFVSQIEDIAKEASSDFEIIQQALRTFFDRMQEEVTKWKRRCTKLQSKLQVLNKPNYVKAQYEGSKNGIQAMMSKSVGRKPSQPKWNKNMRSLRDKTRSSNSMNRSGNHSIQEERLLLQKSLMDIVNVYDKNRTQIYSNLDEMENRVHEFKNTREKLNVQHMGTMTTVEQEMESLCLRSARSAKSNMQSHRTSSASKRPMKSLDGTKRTQKENIENEPNRKMAENAWREIEPYTKPRAVSSNVRSPASKGQSLVPPLPLHNINNNQNGGKNGNQKKPSIDKPPTARSINERPPPAESHRTPRTGRTTGRPPIHKPQDPHSQQPSSRGLKPIDSNRSSQRNITGAIKSGVLVNPILVNPNPMGTSKFDKELESDDDAGATLIFDTGRLQQFSEDYAHLQSLENTDQKIIVKQLLFMKYEGLLKMQAKEEKRIRQEKRRQEREARGQNGSPGKNKKYSKRHSSHGGSGQFNVSNRSKKSAMRNTKDQEAIDKLINISAIQLDSSLSDIGTTEVFKARQKEKALIKDVNLSQILDVSQNISGLKTVTQKDLVELLERKHEEIDALKRGERKRWEWSSNEDGSQSSLREFGKGLEIQTIEKPGNNIDNVTISPSNVQLQVPSKSPQMDRIPSNENQFGSALSSIVAERNGDRQRSNYNSNEAQNETGNQETMAEGNRDQSFNNDSLVYEDFDQQTPQQVRQSQQMAQNISHAQAQQRNGNRNNLISQYDHAQATTKNRGGLLNGSGGALGISQVANATANSEESQFYLQQKKSLEVITERQSEFSNTMGTYARPSQRSKKSHNQSASHQKTGIAGTQGVSGINASGSALDNSSIHQNSSRIMHGSQHNRYDTQKQVQSFADIAGDHHDENEVKSYHQKFKALQQQHNNSQLQMPGFSQIYANVPMNECHSALDLEVSVNEKDKMKQQYMSSTEGKSRKSSKLSKKSNTEHFTDMAAQTPIRNVGPQTTKIGKNKRNAGISEESGASQPINNCELLSELKNINLNKDNPHDKRDPRELDMVSSSKSYIDQSYLDESDAASNNHPSHRANNERYSSLKKKRKRKDRETNRLTTPTKGLIRSNSEMYLKKTDMQEEEDAFFVPIMYAAEATMTNNQLSQQMSNECARVRIDSSVLNNLTRYIEATNFYSAQRLNQSAIDRSQFGAETNNTQLHYFSTALYNQIQKLFMQAQQPSASNNLTKGAKTLKSIGSTSKHLIGDQHSIIKSGLNITSLLDQSTQPQFYKQTLMMLQHMQGYQQHNLNPVVGLLFSNSLQSLTQSQLGKLRNNNYTNTVNASPGQALQKSGWQMPQSSPIVEHLQQLTSTQSKPQDRSDFKRSLLESIKSVPPMYHHHNSSIHPENLTQHQKSELERKNVQEKFKSEVVGKGKPNHSQSGHSRGLSKETVSSYVHQIKRPTTNVGNYHTVSKHTTTTGDNSTNQQSMLAYNTATPDIVSHKDIIVTTNSSVVIDSHNSLQQAQHMHQKSSDYDNSASVERSADRSSSGVQSQLQRKLKLKSKGMFIQETGQKSGHQQKAQGKLVQGQPARKLGGSVGRQISGSGVVSVSNAPTNQSQFKFQLNIKRDGSKDSQGKAGQLTAQQLQSQPQMTQLQQLQLKEQQMQSVPASQISINTNTRSGSSSDKKNSVVKRVNIRKIPIKRMVDGKITKSQGIQISRASHITQIGSNQLQLAIQQQSSKQDTNNSNISGNDVNAKLQPVVNLSKILVNNANTVTQQTLSKSSNLKFYHENITRN